MLKQLSSSINSPNFLTLLFLASPFTRFLQNCLMQLIRQLYSFSQFHKADGWWLGYYGQTPFLSPACLKQHWPGTIFKWHSLQTFRDLLRLMTQLVNIIFMPQCFLCPLPTISSFSALVSCESLMIIIQRCFDRITCQYLHTYINRVLLPLWFV